MGENLLALAVLLLSVVATAWIASRRSGQRGGSSGSHRPVRHVAAMGSIDQGRRILRSNRRIIPLARTTSPRAHLRVVRSAVHSPVTSPVRW